MPLQPPVLDDRTFEQLLGEAKRRIPVHTPEWTNFEVESDPGITIVQLFAFLTESLLFRANRIPERNRFKFLQLLGIPLQPAAAAAGIVAIRNERGPIQVLTLDAGVILSAGNVSFLSLDGVSVPPVDSQVLYKQLIQRTDPRYAEFQAKYEAVRAALVAAAPTSGDESAAPITLDFYETTPLPTPTPSEPAPVLDLGTQSIDRAVYIALLAPKNVPVEDVRDTIANKTLSIGIVPALSDEVQPLRPHGSTSTRTQLPTLIYEIPDVRGGTPVARWQRLRIVHEPNVLDEVGIVQLELPGRASLSTWAFSEPEQEGTGDFPPRMDDERDRDRIVTWLRLRLVSTTTTSATATGRLTWVGINATRVRQAIPVSGELLGTGTGEPDQTFKIANTPVLPDSVKVDVEDLNGQWRPWRVTDDLLTADFDSEVFALDAEAGEVRFGDGLRGARPPAGCRVRVSYEWGGGRQGNVTVGAINAGPDVRLQGGYKIENPVPTWGGDEGESVSDGERNVPLYVRHRDRLVTERDFRDVTNRTPGVDMGRVEVLSLFHPDRPSEESPGVVTLMVIPRYDALRPRWPSPDRLFLQLVCAHLEPRRLVTTELHVRGPVYVPVYISVGVQVRAGHFRDVVLQAVRQRLEEYLSALPPDGPDGEGWPLGRHIVQKELEAVVARVTGVQFVQSMEVGVSSQRGLDNYALGGLQLPMLAIASVREGDAEPLASLGGGPPPIPPDVVPVPVSRTKC